MIHTVEFAITTSAGGAYDSSATPLSAPHANVSDHRKGPLLLYAVEWIDGDLEDGVDATLSMTSTSSGVDKTLLTLTNADNDAWYYPRVPTSDNTGVGTLFYTPQVVEGTLKLVVTDGGTTKTGKCIVYLLEV